MTLKVMPKATRAWGLHYCENCGKTWYTPRETLESWKGKYGQVNIPVKSESYPGHKVMHSYLICQDCANNKLYLKQSTGWYSYR